jgi:alpha-tubulin suppressor-like RCC1 family protein
MNAVHGLWCWGANGQGQLGDGTLLDRRTPVEITLPLAMGEAVLEVGAGEAHTCVRVSTDLTGDLGIGRIICWGRNAEGQVGDTTFDGDVIDIEPPDDADMGVVTHEGTVSRLTPTPIPAITTAAALRVGRRHNCAGIVSGGGADVRCWGLNQHGQLGDGTFVNAATPVVATNYPSIGDIIDLTAGGAHSCVAWLSAGVGRVSCWGRNDASQLGNLGTLDSPSAVLVATTQATNVAQVSAGLDYTCVVTTQTSPARLVRCWGRNEFGQTGTRGYRANRLAAGGVRFVP